MIVGGSNAFFSGNDFCFNDIWVFDPNKEVWQQVTVDFPVPPLGFHAGLLLGTHYIAVGGGSVDGSSCNDVFILDLSDLQAISGKQYQREQRLPDNRVSIYRPLYASPSHSAYPFIYTVGGSIDWNGLTLLNSTVKKYSFTWSPCSLKELCTWKIKQLKIGHEEALPSELSEDINTYWYDGEYPPYKIDSWIL